MKKLLFMLVIFLTGVSAAANAGMYSGWSSYAANKAIDSWFRGETFTPPTTMCVALLTATPNKQTTGATASEVSDPGYVRAELPPAGTNWKGTGGETTQTASTGTTATTSNIPELTFGTTPSTTYTVTHFAVFDSCVTGFGNMIFYGQLAQSKKAVPDGYPPSIKAGQLSFTISN